MKKKLNTGAISPLIRKYRHILFCLLLGILTSQMSCRNVSFGMATNERSLLTKMEAENIAKKKFKDLNYGPLESHRITVMDQESEWCVFFEGIGNLARPGHHLIISIDKKTRACTVEYGE